MIGNLIVFALILTFVLQNSTTDKGVLNSNPIKTGSLVPSPLDQLSSAQIALTVSKMTSLPETTPITNQADSQKAELAMASSTSGNIVLKPQVIDTKTKSIANLVYYTVQPGDTLSGLASTFGVTSNSISWSNNLGGSNPKAGTKLVIPPVNGVVYTIKAGDTAQGLASKYGSSASDIISFNNGEVSGLQVGQNIVIPNGSIQAPVFVSFYGGNGYDFGYCTWYVANQVAVPTNWGNAATWAYYARQSGWNVSSNPSVGAIAQTPYAAGGQGHVAVVRAVNGDGTIWVSEMNSFGQKSMTDSTPYGGWDRTDWKIVSTSHFPNYISQ
ncbi:LysM peptidoglycan-binding domain-containing protein [bacterium]|nr:LysM peptidoglycan-binding domain-containing protein [bacterium]